MGHPPVDQEQPFSGHIKPRRIPSRFLNARKSRLPDQSANRYQAYLNKIRRRFLVLLPHDHALSKRADQSSGQLKEEQPPPGERKALSEKEHSARKRKKLARTLRDDPWSHFFLRRRRYSSTWREGYAKEKHKLSKLKLDERRAAYLADYEVDRSKWEALYMQRARPEISKTQEPQIEEKEPDEEEEISPLKLFGISGHSLPVVSPVTTVPSTPHVLEGIGKNEWTLHIKSIR